MHFSECIIRNRSCFVCNIASALAPYNVYLFVELGRWLNKCSVIFIIITTLESVLFLFGFVARAQPISSLADNQLSNELTND